MRKILLILLCALVLLASCSPTFRKFRTINNSESEWKMFRNNLTGYYQEGIYGAYLNNLLWKGDLKSRSYSSPVATESYVAIGALDSYMYFFDINTGKRINIYRYDAPPSKSPMISNKLIYNATGPDDNMLSALNLISGKFVFTERYAEISSPLVGDEKCVYAGDYAGRVFCVDKFAGTFHWSFQTGGAVLNAPSIRNDVLYIGSLDRKMYALDRNSGEKIWEFEALEGINSAPAVDERVYFGSYDNYVYALDAETGELEWKFKTGGQVISSPIIDDNHVYIGSNDNRMYCFNKLNGAVVWAYETGGIVNSTPLVLEDVIVFGSGDGNIYMLNKRDGNLIFAHETKDMVLSSPIYFDEKLFISSLDKHLYCFGN